MDHDFSGASGMALHYSIILFLVGSSFAFFVFLWFKNRLDLDEEPKYQMLEKEESHDGR